MDPTICKRLERVEDGLLDAVVGDDSALKNFMTGWGALISDIQMAKEAGLLQDATIQLAHSTASRVLILAESFVEFQTQDDAITSAINQTLGKLFASAAMNDGADAESCLNPSQNANTQTLRSSTYILSASKWLLDNLHDPYPRKEFKGRLSQETGTSIKDIDAWFIQARKRMGWSELRRTHFSNKRQEIVNAASRFFGRGDPRPLSAELEMQFARVQHQAEQLYSGKHLRDNDNFSASIATARGHKADKDKWRCPDKDIWHQPGAKVTSISSPQRSRKRRYDTNANDEVGSRTRKRFRMLEQADDNAHTPYHVVAPPKNSHESPDSGYSNTTEEQPNPSRRKRRLSTGGIPSYRVCQPRPQVVSDPIVNCQDHYNFPVSGFRLEDHNLSTSLQLEIFDPNTLDDGSFLSSIFGEPTPVSRSRVFDQTLEGPNLGISALSTKTGVSGTYSNTEDYLGLLNPGISSTMGHNTNALPDFVFDSNWLPSLFDNAFNEILKASDDFFPSDVLSFSPPLSEPGLTSAFC